MNIKKYSFPCLIMLMIIGAVACKKNNGFNAVISEDTSKPLPVSNIKVDNFNGGANITYNLPNSQNILYVLAKYKINDNTDRETKSSYYQDTVVVEGFAKAKPYQVTLYTVSRANVMSDPVTVTVNPLTPVYSVVRPSVNLTADFSGVNITAENPLKKQIGIVVLSYNNNTKSLEIEDQRFTKDPIINYSVTGFSSTQRQFGVYVTDRWGNISDTLQKALVPLAEEAVDKSKFSVLNLNTDSPIDFGWTLPYLWDGKQDGNGWHTRYGVALPYSCSFGIGKTYKLSRFVLYERTGDQYTYKFANPKVFALWGTNSSTPTDVQLPVTAAEGTVIGNWINLGNFRFPDPPSGSLPTAINSSDNDFVKNGVSFKMPSAAPAVKYLRIAVSTVWGNEAAAHLMEFTPYGTPQ
ncbi:DUF4959 domain-containing protein [Pedobacter miscanthi]|uniref:DUF4959 domain-containing protein n=1 Tax=Pedobacter miscanthi TaxID=2259170 RepID=A0A366KMD4_9SPHI|nr:DUF4959 domain-containing protein [Pedobacter miscanthi]RBQ02433.1 hypothetical protein DRW42_26755 [Pedobacter miscanthi]